MLCFFVQLDLQLERQSAHSVFVINVVREMIGVRRKLCSGRKFELIASELLIFAIDLIWAGRLFFRGAVRPVFVVLIFVSKRFASRVDRPMIGTNGRWLGDHCRGAAARPNTR